ncbi:MAG: hypothetical protein KIT84_30540 [Labilithrix sp.]|nr:hypothetical protein [Labilithrix sp.]MCW5815405.1 hypothetical protein [Labilithrix sp.]
MKPAFPATAPLRVAGYREAAPERTPTSLSDADRAVLDREEERWRRRSSVWRSAIFAAVGLTVVSSVVVFAVAAFVGGWTAVQLTTPILWMPALLTAHAYDRFATKHQRAATEAAAERRMRVAAYEEENALEDEDARSALRR